MTTSEKIPNGWTRPAVTFRLSPGRRQDLLALCGDDTDSLTPTAALDRAIALARDTLMKDAKPINSGVVLSSAKIGDPEMPGVPQGDDRGRGIDRQVFDELTNLLHEEHQELRDFLTAQTSRSGEILAAFASQIKELRDTIIAAATESDADDNGGGDNTEQQQQAGGGSQDSKNPVLIRDWLEREVAGLPRQAFVVKAQWQTTRRASVDSVWIELLVQRIVTASVQGQSGQGTQGFTRLSASVQDAVSSPLTSPLPFYVRCQCDAQKVWLLSLHQIAYDGQLGPSVFTIRV